MIEFGHMKFDNFSLERLRNITHEEDDFAIAKLLLNKLYPAILKHMKAEKQPSYTFGRTTIAESIPYLDIFHQPALNCSSAASNKDS